MPEPPLALIADDQPHILLALDHLVRTAGDVQVITVNNSHEAIHLATQRLPALVMIGLTIPQIDAYTACRMIRDQWQQHPGQIWLIAGQLLETDPDYAREAGADRVITNPFDPNLVVDLVRQALGWQNQSVRPRR